MNPRDVPITREMVAGWLSEWTKENPTPPYQTSIKDFLKTKVEALDLSSDVVNTDAHDNLGSSTPIVKMIVDDLPSYGYQIT